MQHGQLFPLGVSEFQRQVLTRQSGGALFVRTGISNWVSRTFHRCGPRGVFIGEPEQPVLQIEIGGIARETAATLGLLAKL